MIDIEYDGSHHEEMHTSVYDGKITEPLYELIDRAMDYYIINNLYNGLKSRSDSLLFKNITISKLKPMFEATNDVKTTRFKFVVDLLNIIERIMIWLEKTEIFEEERLIYIQGNRMSQINNILE